MKKRLLTLGIVFASLATSPVFAGPAGLYTGLFYETTGVQHETSGLFRMLLNSSGTYSARFFIGARSHVCTGLFAPDGRTTNSIRHPGGGPLTVVLNIETNDAQVTGTISDGAFVAELLGDLAPVSAGTNTAALAGRYTLLVPPGSDDPSIPMGYGYGLASLRPYGTVFLLARLADDRTITQVSTVSKDGHWPFYARLYGNRGSVLGWINFADQPTNDFSGDIMWTRPTFHGSWYHDFGFSNQTTVVGSRYLVPPTPTNSILNFTTGRVEFAGALLSSPFTNDIALLPRARVVNNSSNRLYMNFNLPWGTFVGGVREPQSGRPFLFKGAVLQKANYGAGSFHGGNRNGRVYFGP